MCAAAFVPYTPLLLLQSSAIGSRSFAAMMLGMAYLVNSCISAVAMRLVVARAKKCWDFGATIYILHFLLTWVVDGFPKHTMWWLLMAACMVSTVLLGEYLCVQFEMMDIPITTLGMHPTLALLIWGATAANKVYALLVSSAVGNRV
jgi:hypothetical protein